MSEPHLISLTQAGERLGCHAQTVRRMIARGELVGYRIGPRMVRVDLAELEQLARPIPAA